MMSKNKLVIGSIENCNLPEFGIFDMQVRIDTGAKTSSLHVDNLMRCKVGGKPWVKFDLHPNIHNVDEVVQCKAPLHDIRRIKSSNGTAEERYVIKTSFHLGELNWPIEISLTDRSDMSYLMLFGREGMGNKVLVDPSKTFLLDSDK
jgi:hypothetical protein